MAECSHNCMNCVFKELSLFEDLNYSDLEILESNRKSVEYKKGETIYKEGMTTNDLICLNSGKVKIVKKIRNNKEETIIDLKRPVDFIGFQSLMSNSAFQDSAITLEDSRICAISKNDLLTVIKRNPDFALKIISDQAKSLQTVNERLIALTGKNMKSRLCDSLLVIGEVYGMNNDGTLNAILKRREIASLSNMTTANVIRTLSELAKEGLIELINKEIKLVNVNKVYNLAHS